MMLFDVKARKWTELLKAQVVGYHVWSKDSKYVYVLDTSSDLKLVFFRIRISDHKFERVADFMVPKGLLSGAHGPWSVLAPDGSPIFMRDLSNSEIYALDVDLP